MADISSKPSRLRAGEQDKHLPRCVSCGRDFQKLEGNFPASQSPIYAGNKGHLPVCKQCVDKLYEHYCKVLKDEEEALRRICMKFDIYYNKGISNASSKTPVTRSRIQAYISKTNLIQYRGNTYDTTLDEESDYIISSVDDAQREDGGISEELINFWGVGSFNADDYRNLENHYQMLKKQNPNCDSNQEIFIKSLCRLNLLQIRALKDNSSKAYIDANAEYTKTFRQAGLKTVQENDSSNNAPLGVTLAEISQYTPEEYYKDKKLYKDFDGIGEYMQRFVFRPLRNLMFGTKERDGEYSVTDGDNDGNV